MTEVSYILLGVLKVLGKHNKCDNVTETNE